MKQKFKSLGVLLSIVLCFTLVVPNVNAATKVKINKKTASIYVGKTVQLKITGTKKKVTWKSNKKKVATVTAKGKVKGIKKGSATITATVSKKKYTCKVTVKEKVTTNTTETPSATSTLAPVVTGGLPAITKRPVTTSAPPIKITSSPVATSTTKPIETKQPTTIATVSPTQKVTSTPSPTPTQNPVVTLSAIDACNVGESYTSKNGFEVCVKSVSSEAIGTNYLCKISYSIKNNTTEILDPPIFRVFDEEGKVYTQYGIYSDIYPGASVNRSYTFSITNDARPIILELVTDITESYSTYFNKLNTNELHWIVE